MFQNQLSKLCSVKSTCVHFFDFKNWLLKIESKLGIWIRITYPTHLPILKTFEYVLRIPHTCPF